MQEKWISKIKILFELYELRFVMSKEKWSPIEVVQFWRRKKEIKMSFYYAGKYYWKREKKNY